MFTTKRQLITRTTYLKFRSRARTIKISLIWKHMLGREWNLIIADRQRFLDYYFDLSKNCTIFISHQITKFFWKYIENCQHNRHHVLAVRSLRNLIPRRLTKKFSEIPWRLLKLSCLQRIVRVWVKPFHTFKVFGHAFEQFLIVLNILWQTISNVYDPYNLNLHGDVTWIHIEFQKEKLLHLMQICFN